MTDAAPGRDHRRRFRRARRRAGAEACAGRSHAARPAQPPPVPAAALPGGDGRPLARRHRAPIRWILRKQPNVRVLLAKSRASTSRRKPVVLDRRRRSRRTTISSSPPARPTRISATTSGSAFAPGLKSLDDALDDPAADAARVRERRARGRPRAQRRLLTSSSSAAARPASRWPAPSPKSRATRWPTSSDDRSTRIADRADRGRAEHPRDISRRPAAGGAPRRCSAWASRSGKGRA